MVLGSGHKQWILLLLWVLPAWAVGVMGQGVLRGEVADKVTKEPLPFATVSLVGTELGTATDASGLYVLKDVEPGVYAVEVRYLGYETLVVYDIEVTVARERYLRLDLIERAEELEEIEVRSKNSFITSEESPLSVKTLGGNEVRRMPGANRDVSRVVRSLPGVASTPSFRNDILIRGGGPSENVFFIDDIPVPVINHFQTQGSSGGPAGMINVDLLDEVELFTSAFPASKGNALSGVFDFKFRSIRPEKWNYLATVGVSEVGFTGQGPVGAKGSLIMSVRQSYLDFVLPLLQLPFVPRYTDGQFKYQHNFNKNHRLTVLGIGAYDLFVLKPKIVDNIEDIDQRDAAQLAVDRIPMNGQWNYTLGAKYEYYSGNSTTQLVVSRNHLTNWAKKFRNNDESAENLLDYLSTETAYHVRGERYHAWGSWQLSYGAQYAFSQYTVDVFLRALTQTGPLDVNYDSRIGIHSLGFFVQGSKLLWQKLLVSLGARVDDNAFLRIKNGKIPFIRNFSPRMALSYNFLPRWKFNANVGVYYQLPPYTTLGYRDFFTDELVNLDLDYIRSSHAVAGFSFDVNKAAQITVEGFYKLYQQYPFLLREGVALGNLGADFGVVGPEPAESTASGRSRGVEVSFQQKFYRGFSAVGAYTYYQSQFTNQDNELVASAWDYNHLVSLSLSKRFNTTTLKRRKKKQDRPVVKANWEIGARWIYTGSGPYTPTNREQALVIANWERQPGGIPDYDLLNTQRNPPFHQLDIRIERRWFYQNFTMTYYLDIQNVYNFKFKSQDTVNVIRDDSGNPVEDPNNPGSYQLRLLPSQVGQLLPSIGFVIEF